MKSVPPTNEKNKHVGDRPKRFPFEGVRDSLQVYRNQSDDDPNHRFTMKSVPSSKTSEDVRPKRPPFEGVRDSLQVYRNKFDNVLNHHFTQLVKIEGEDDGGESL